MTYKVFVSHTEVDTPIAQAITRVINDAFLGQIELYLAVSEVVGGIAWKTELAKNLEEHDAIICIMTPDSLHKPWLYIEWSPFWLRGRTYYTLITSEISVADLVQPMRDRQVIDMTDYSQVRLFFKGLHSDADADIPIPYKYVEDFIRAVEEATVIKLDGKYGIFRKSLKSLPRSDIEKKAIADHFYQLREHEVFQRIVGEIRDDTIKSDIVISTLHDSVFDHNVELQIAHSVSRTINGADKLSDIAIELIRLGDLDTKQLRVLIEDLAGRNQAELRKVALFLAANNQEDTELFSYICDLMTSMAELRKVATYFVMNGQQDSDLFQQLTDRFTNRAELRKVAIEFIEQGHQRSPRFIAIVERLLDESPRSGVTVMERLFDHDRELYKQILDNQADDRSDVKKLKAKLDREGTRRRV